MTAPNCPDCNKPMVKRTAKKTGKQFWGCTQYFSSGCRGYRPYVPEIGRISNPTPQQQACVDWILKHPSQRSRFLMVKAGAGTGKTSLIKHLISIIQEDDPGSEKGYFVYNAHNRDEAKEQGITFARTTHQVGYAALAREVDGKLTMVPDYDDKLKVREILKRYVDQNTGALIPLLCNLMSIYKNLLGEPSAEGIRGYITRFELELPKRYHDNYTGKDKMVVDYDHLAVILRKALKANNEQFDLFDFDDLIYMPVALNLPVRQVDWFFGDEVQDWNACQIELAKRICHDKTQGVWVGDEYQSMYAFRGADTMAMHNIAEGFNCDQLPLSVSFRCPQSHVKDINLRFPEIPFSAFERNTEGTIEDILIHDMPRLLGDDDMVLCRINAPLFQAMIRLLEQNRPVRYRGQDIYGAVKRVIDNNFADENSLEVIIKRCSEAMTELIEEDDYANVTKIDTLEILLLFARRASSKRDILYQIESLTKSRTGPIFTTIHKAKGEEADRVFILFPSLMPHSMAKTPEAQDQERNIEYVARTRAKKVIFEVY